MIPLRPKGRSSDNSRIARDPDSCAAHAADNSDEADTGESMALRLRSQQLGALIEARER
jgi:hypothetical protein